MALWRSSGTEIVTLVGTFDTRTCHTRVSIKLFAVLPTARPGASGLSGKTPAEAAGIEIPCISGRGTIETALCLAARKTTWGGLLSAGLYTVRPLVDGDLMSDDPPSSAETSTVAGVLNVQLTPEMAKVLKEIADRQGTDQGEALSEALVFFDQVTRSSFQGGTVEVPASGVFVPRFRQQIRLPPPSGVIQATLPTSD